jgi:pimeloyl-ACP methyl ester carboxylesterase
MARTPEERFARLSGYPYPDRTLALDGGELRMAYVDEGAHDGEPVLLLHGPPAWSYLWRHVIPMLVEGGCRAIAPDLVGFGRSDKLPRARDHRLDRHVAWVTALLDHLDLRRVTLVAHGASAPLALRLACDAGGAGEGEAGPTGRAGPADAAGRGGSGHAAGGGRVARLVLVAPLFAAREETAELSAQRTGRSRLRRATLRRDPGRLRRAVPRAGAGCRPARAARLPDRRARRPAAARAADPGRVRRAGRAHGWRLERAAPRAARSPGRARDRGGRSLRAGPLAQRGGELALALLAILGRKRGSPPQV